MRAVLTAAPGDLERGLSATVVPFDDARQLPSAVYAGEVARMLDERLFEGAWLAVATEAELSEPGAYASLEVMGERVIAICGADLEVRAVADRCVHRGTPLTAGACGKLERLSLVCPYHGLAYDLDGRARVDGAPSLRLDADAALPRFRVARRHGYVFVCRSSSAPELGPGPPWLERASLFALRLGRRTEHDVAASWKLLAQNFQESHHFPSVHPWLEAVTPWARSTSVTEDGEGWLGGTMTLEPGAETVSTTRALEGRPYVAAEGDRRAVFDALVFPTFLTSLQPDYLLTYRLVPRAVDRTTVIADILFHAEALRPGFDPSSVYAFWDRTNAEDRAICERQQRGVASRSYVPGRYAESEDGLHAFDARLARAYLDLLGQAP